jgi:hypothetical protein
MLPSRVPIVDNKKTETAIYSPGSKVLDFFRHWKHALSRAFTLGEAEVVDVLKVLALISESYAFPKHMLPHTF